MFVIPVVTLDEGALPISTVLQNITTHTDLKSKAAEVHLLNRKLASMDSQSIQDTEEQCFPVILVSIIIASVANAIRTVQP